MENLYVFDTQQNFSEEEGHHINFWQLSKNHVAVLNARALIQNQEITEKHRIYTNEFLQKDPGLRSFRLLTRKQNTCLFCLVFKGNFIENMAKKRIGKPQKSKRHKKLKPIHDLER